MQHAPGSAQHPRQLGPYGIPPATGNPNLFRRPLETMPGGRSELQNLGGSLPHPLLPVPWQAQPQLPPTAAFRQPQQRQQQQRQQQRQQQLMQLQEPPPPPPPPPQQLLYDQHEAAYAAHASQGGPPPTPGPAQRMSVAARTIIGNYPGKTANQDAYVMQPLDPLRSGSGGGAVASPLSRRSPQPLSSSLTTPLTTAPPTATGRGAARASNWNLEEGSSSLPAPPSRWGSQSPLGSSGGGGDDGGGGMSGGDRKGSTRDDLTAAAGGDAIFGVYDGHGQHGHHVSRFIKERLALELGQLGDAQLRDDTAAARELAMAHHRANEALKKSGIDCSLSGSTAITCLKRGRRLLVANVGDSRAVLGRATADGRVEAHDLSVDQKPDHPIERARIEGGGGHVHPSIVPGAGYVGPARVWDPSRRFGLACARAMGDTLYYGPNRSGVIAEPEVASYRLDQNDKHIIIGSDGLWDRLSSQEAVEIVRSCPSVEHASERLTQLARERWRRHGPVADDITAVVVSFQ